MSGYSVAISLASLCILAGCVYFAFRIYPRLRNVVQKYPLFAVRDEIVMLKLKGAFDADPELYDYYMHICNQLIVRSRELNFWMFLASLANMEPDPQLARRLEQTAPEIKEMDQQLWQAVLKIIYDNSTLLRFLVITGLYRHFRKRVASQRLNNPAMLPVRQYVRIHDFCHT